MTLPTAGRYPRPFLMYASGRLINSLAWQEVAPYSSRRHSQDIGSLRKRDFARLNLHLVLLFFLCIWCQLEIK